MSTDGCTSLFPESEAVKFLPPKTMAALRKITQEKEVDGADIDGLAKCPRCPFACIIENEHERLLHCQNEDCGAVTCRQCQKVSPGSARAVDYRHARRALTLGPVNRTIICPRRAKKSTRTPKSTPSTASRKQCRRLSFAAALLPSAASLTLKRTDATSQ